MISDRGAGQPDFRCLRVIFIIDKPSRIEPLYGNRQRGVFRCSKRRWLPAASAGPGHHSAGGLTDAAPNMSEMAAGMDVRRIGQVPILSVYATILGRSLVLAGSASRFVPGR